MKIDGFKENIMTGKEMSSEVNINENVQAFYKRLPSKRYRYFFGTLDSHGYLSNLATSLEAIGEKAVVLNLGQNRFGHYSRNETAFFLKKFKRAHFSFFESRALSRFNLFRYLLTLNYVFWSWTIVFWVATSFDIVHFKSGESFFKSGIDLKIMRFFGCRLITLFLGSDSRAPYLAPSSSLDTESMRLLTQKQQQNVERADRQFDIVMDGLLSAHFHIKPFVMWPCLGLNVDNNWTEKFYIPTNTQEAIDRDGYKKPVHILHAPSDPKLKGSDVIRRVIKKLEAEGLKIKYTELVGVSNETVLQEIANSDIVVDELYSDTFGATLAIEAASLGVPVIVGTFGKEELSELIPKEFQLPSCLIHPQELENELRKLILHPELRMKYENELRQYMALNQNSKAFGARYKAIATGNIPASWLVDPQDCTYIGGIGADIEVIRANVRNIVELGGGAALCVDDKPKTYEALLRFSMIRFPEDTKFN